jgi:hypothetical protein
VKDHLSNPGKFFVRIQAADYSEETIVEAGVDDMRLFTYSCEDTCPADLDKNGVVGQADLGILLADYGCTSAASGFCPGDIDGDGVSGQSDLGVLLAAWWTVCE